MDHWGITTEIANKVPSVQILKTLRTAASQLRYIPRSSLSRPVRSCQSSTQPDEFIKFPILNCSQLQSNIRPLCDRSTAQSKGLGKSKEIMLCLPYSLHGLVIAFVF
jgi:hypothetical protein